MIETVQKDCKHKDCVYRRLLDTHVPYCDYIGIMGYSRNCDISKCDKYVKGKLRRIARTGSYNIIYDI